MIKYLFLIQLGLLVSGLRDIDPRPLRHWQNSWNSNPIEMTKTNRYEYGVGMTFYLNPTTTIQNAFMEFVFPDGFDLTSAGCDAAVNIGCTLTSINGQKITIGNIQLNSGVDTIVGVSGVRTPTLTGGYGPFQIVTRFYEFGQIIDINRAFGSVGISPDEFEIDTLDVSMVSGSNKVGAKGNTLSFKFQIHSDLWKHDIFQLTVDSKWSISVGASCSSAKYEGRWNHFNGSNVNSIHDLDCAVNGYQVLIYGLANDIDVSLHEDYKYVDLRVNSISNPDRDYPDNEYSWKVETVRFQTRTVLEEGLFSNGPATEPAVISSASYTPTWGMDSSEIVEGMSLYMDVQFTTINKIPQGGSAVITLTEKVENNDWAGIDCYLIDYLPYSDESNYAKCDAAGYHQVIISDLPELSDSQTLKFRVISEFLDSTQVSAISYITTYSSPAGYVIDQSTQSLAIFSISTSTEAKLMDEFNILLTDEAGTTSDRNSAGGDDTTAHDYYFKVHYKVSANENTADGTQVTVYLPLSTSADSDFEFFITSAAKAKYVEGSKDLRDSVSGVTAMDGTGTNLDMATLTSNDDSNTNPGHLRWNLNTQTAGNYPTSTQEQTVGFYTETTDSKLGWPQVATNAATKYECRIDVVSTNATQSHAPMRRAVRVSILARDWTTRTLSGYTCLDPTHGMLYNAELQPSKTIFPGDGTDKKYYIDLQFPVTADATGMLDGLDSGLADGDSYPVVCENAITTATADLDDNVGTTTQDAIRLKAFGLFDTSTAANCYFPLGVNGANDNGATVGLIAFIPRGYFQLINDPRIKYVYYEQVDQTATLSTAKASDWAVLSVATDSDSKIGGDTVAPFNVQSTAVAGAVTDIIQIVFPPGTTFASTVTMSYRSATLTGLKIFSSPNHNFKFPTIAGITSDSTALTEAQDHNIVISSITLPLGRETATPAKMYGYHGSTTAAVCQENSEFDLNISNGAMTVSSISPNQVKGRGPDSVDIDMVVVFSTAHGARVGNYIVLNLDSNWDVSSKTSCTVTGLTNESTSNTVTCTLVGSTFTVSGFADWTTDPSSTQITMTITRLLPPVYNSNITTRDFVSSLKTQLTASITTDGSIDEFDTTSSTNNISVTAPNADGVSTIVSIVSYPQNASQSSVDFRMKFSLQHYLPSFGQIQINAPINLELTSGNINDFCWCNLRYEKCQRSGNFIVLTTAEDYTAGNEIDLYIDSGVSTPTVVGLTTGGFTLLSSWQSETIDEDTAAITDERKFNTLATLTSSLDIDTTQGITFDPMTGGEFADYTFRFKSSVPLGSTDLIKITFPNEFDAFVGDAGEWFENDPGTFYIECESEVIGSILCTVEHWEVKIQGNSEITANTQISITIKNVRNPAPKETSGNFSIAHIEAAGAYLAFNPTFGTVTPTALAKNILVKMVEADGDNLFDTNVDYQFRFYLDDTISDTKNLKVKFPRQYDLWINDGVSYYTWATDYADYNDYSTNSKAQKWIEDPDCTTDHNMVSLNSPITTYSFNMTDEIHWEIRSVSNPQWAEDRNPEANWDFDKTDSDIWTLYNYWVNKFEFFVYDKTTSSHQYTSRSYGMLNSAYIGLDYVSRELFVNNYDPQNKSNRIIVYAGTQTQDIKITTSGEDAPMAARKVELNPYTNPRTSDADGLSYSSRLHSFNFMQADLEIWFRVGASIDMAKGLYYINWNMHEQHQEGSKHYHYHPPVKTLVEVVAKTPGRHSISVEQDSNITFQVGYTSPPIRLSVANSPASDVTVNLTSSTSGITVNPLSVVFTPDVNERYFEITIESSVQDSTESHSINFNLSGTDAEVYNIVTAYTFSSGSVEEPEIENVVEWNFGTCSRTSCSFTPTVNTIGVLYYQFSVAGTGCGTFDQVKSGENVLTGDQANELDINETIEHANKSSDPHANETWVQFKQSQFISHSQKVWYGALSYIDSDFSVGIHTVTPNWLWSSTNYDICGYFENAYGTTIAVGTTTFTTATMDESKQYMAIFDGEIHEAFESEIRESISFYQGVNPKRNEFITRIERSSRRAQDGGDDFVAAQTEFVFTLYADRERASPTASTIISLTSDELASLKSDLQREFSNNLDSITLMSDFVRTEPQWTVAPILLATSTNSIYMSARSSIEGQICCIAVEGHNIQLPAGEQVYLGLGPVNTDVEGVWVTSDLNQSNVIVLKDLDQGTIYTVYCTAVDSYPLWPTLMVYTQESPIAGIYARTGWTQAHDDDEEDHAMRILVTPILMMFVLLF